LKWDCQIVVVLRLMNFNLWNVISCGFENDGISTVKQTGEQFTIEVLVRGNPSRGTQGFWQH
jgi:hypothetical protein